MSAHNSSPSLGGEVALVTGASSGLGRATALALASAGAATGLVGRSKRELEQVAGEITTSGGQALAMSLDLGDDEQARSAAERVVQAFGSITILVNAAGTDVPSPVEELTVGEWDRVLNVNLRAPFLLAKAVFPHMRRAGSGTIINISSVAGRRGWANASAYCASKFGLTGLTQAIAAEGKPHNIRATVLYPGGMDTNWGTWIPAERNAAQRKPSSPRKALPPDQVAELIVWIASAPAELVLNEAVIGPIDEEGWP